MIRTHILGFPRMGANRELKFALEQHWRGDIDAEALSAMGRGIRARHWAMQKEAELDFVCVGDFSFYDHVADHIELFGCEPARFGFTGAEPPMARYFTMARGAIGTAPPYGQPHDADCGCAPDAQAGAPALEMTKWFDTNYHYLVPEFEPTTCFRLASSRLLAEVAEAQALGHPVKAVLLGPLTFLWLGKSRTVGFDRLDLLDSLLPVYCELLDKLHALGVQWVQMDEPVLGMDLPGRWVLAFGRAYHTLQTAKVSIMLATYFSPLEENLSYASKLPVAALHVDAVRSEHELQAIVHWLSPDQALSVGVIDGRNIWRADLDRALILLRAVMARRNKRLWIAPSCSLLHVPLHLRDDPGLDPELRSWLSGGVEKLEELKLLKHALTHGESTVHGALLQARQAVAARRSSPRVTNPVVTQRLAQLAADADQRRSSFTQRRLVQQEHLQLPAFPTTTIGSFPQTTEIRQVRAAHKRGEVSTDTYRQTMHRSIAHAVRQQEEIGLDVLVHGEAERNDMVEYFGEQLDGFAMTANGWVQSYGSRCVKPPILFGDVSRPQPMTVEWARYAQELTRKPMKGMLTGPVTILQWSFVRDDQSRADTAMQIALAIRDEVTDLEAAGIGIIQIDEPAMREGMPIRRAQWGAYLKWAVRAFRIAASGARDQTQIHTHMCYSEFNDILPEIAAMDADVITIETSRSGMELLRGFGAFAYPNDIGPGVYDIHSPRVPSAEEMARLMRKAADVVPSHRLWVNPDCGLKTRAWPETRAALVNMVEAARQLRLDQLDFAVPAALSRVVNHASASFTQ